MSEEPKLALEPVMRLIMILPVLALAALSACGTTERTTVVSAPPGSTVIVPASGNVQVVPPHGD